MTDGLIETVLARLLACGDVEEPEAFLNDRECDEPPLYTRLAHLSFLDHLNADEKNRTLLGAALLQLDRIVKTASSQLPIPRLREYRKLPRQADSSMGDFSADEGLGRNVSGGTRPRLSWGRSPL